MKKNSSMVVRGEINKAQEFMKSLMKRSGQGGKYLTGLPNNIDYHDLLIGRKDKALKVLASLLELAPNDHLLLYNRACLSALQGKSREALEYLEKSLKVKTVFEVKDKYHILNDQNLKSLWEMHEFMELMKKYKIAD